jgi:NTE family protein
VNRRITKEMWDAVPVAETKRASLALQGGGAHGAFTWGVLDRLLEEPNFQIDGVSATSSGAMNAVVLAHGLTVGGRDGAKQALAEFWRNVSEVGKTTLLQPSWYDRLAHNHGLDRRHSSSSIC